MYYCIWGTGLKIPVYGWSIKFSLSPFSLSLSLSLYLSISLCVYSCSYRRGSEYANCISCWAMRASTSRGVLSMTRNCIWWWGSISGDRWNEEYPFIVITPRSTQNRSGSTFYDSIFGLNRSVEKIYQYYIRIRQTILYYSIIIICLLPMIMI